LGVFGGGFKTQMRGGHIRKSSKLNEGWVVERIKICEKGAFDQLDF